jgi:hypothetical protein
VSRIFPVAERYSPGVTAEAFNLLNRSDDQGPIENFFSVP